MSPSSCMSPEEAHLLLRKWNEEQTSLYMVLSVGSPPMRCRINMPGLIAELEPDLVIRHARGSADGFLKCAWADIESFAYLELREDAERLTGYPGAPEFMRNRSILAIRAKQELLIRLVDLTVPF